MKKVAPNWMDCNCLCHGDWGEADQSGIGKECPHCEPDKYPEYEIGIDKAKGEDFTMINGKRA